MAFLPFFVFVVFHLPEMRLIFSPGAKMWKRNEIGFFGGIGLKEAGGRG